VKTIRWSQRRKQRNYNVRVDPRPAIARSISRYFTEQSAAAASRYSISSQVTASGDFEITVGFSTTNSTSVQSLFGSAGDFQCYAALNFQGVPGRLIFFIGGASATSSVVLNCYAGKLHTLKIIRISGAVSVYLDDVFVTSGTNSNDLVISQIGGNNFGRYFTGIISDVKITSAGIPLLDLPLGAPIPDSQIIPNNAYGNPGAPEFVTAVNLTSAASANYSLISSAWIGDNLISDSAFDTGVPWNAGASWNVHDGVAEFYNADNVGTGLLQNAANVIASGSRYRLSFDLILLQSAVAYRLRTSAITDVASSGHYDIDMTAGVDNSYVGFVARVGAQGILDNVTVKRILEVA
jgi:hypothetical protein